MRESAPTFNPSTSAFVMNATNILGLTGKFCIGENKRASWHCKTSTTGYGHQGVKRNRRADSVGLLVLGYIRQCNEIE